MQVHLGPVFSLPLIPHLKVESFNPVGQQLQQVDTVPLKLVVALALGPVVVRRLALLLGHHEGGHLEREDQPRPPGRTYPRADDFDHALAPVLDGFPRVLGHSPVGKEASALPPGHDLLTVEGGLGVRDEVHHGHVEVLPLPVAVEGDPPRQSAVLRVQIQLNPLHFYSIH